MVIETGAILTELAGAAEAAAEAVEAAEVVGESTEAVTEAVTVVKNAPEFGSFAKSGVEPIGENNLSNIFNNIPTELRPDARNYLDEIPESNVEMRSARIKELGTYNSPVEINSNACDYLKELDCTSSDWANFSDEQQQEILTNIQERLNSVKLDAKSLEFKHSYNEEIQQAYLERIKEGSEVNTVHTRNEALEGSKHPETGVRFEKKTIELDSGEKIEGVFPQFDSTFEAKLSKELYLESDSKQFEECGKQLKQKFNEDPEFRKQFSERAKDDIMNERTPPYGYTWHHNEVPGKMQLVAYETHAKTGHTGGKIIWGGGNENR